MVKQALLTLRRGHDLFMFFDAGICREALGLPAQAARGKGKVVNKSSSGSKVVGLDIAPTDDVAMADDGSGSRKKRKRRRRKRKRKGRGKAMDGINDAFADGLMVPAVASPLPGEGLIAGGAITESSSTTTATRVLRARRSASRSPPPRVDAAAFVTQQNFTAGDRVTFHGLVSRPELSGLTGSVISVDSSTGRVAVAVSGMESIRVKPTNLRRSIFA